MSGFSGQKENDSNPLGPFSNQPLNSGVLEDSKLGLILFSIYILALANCTPPPHFKHYLYPKIYSSNKDLLPKTFDKGLQK